MSAPTNFHTAAVQDFRRYAFDRLRRESQGYWYSTPSGRWYEPPNKRLQRPGAIAYEVDRMTDDFVRHNYYYPNYQLPDDVRYFSIYHWREQEWDQPGKRTKRAYDY